MPKHTDRLYDVAHRLIHLMPSRDGNGGIFTKNGKINDVTLRDTIIPLY